MSAANSTFVLDHTPVGSDLPLVTRLGLNSAYFDAMLSLIPAKYYLREEEDEEDDAGDVQYHRVCCHHDILCSLISTSYALDILTSCARRIG